MKDDHAQRFGELDEAVQELLFRMKPEHVETLEYLSTLPRDEVRGLVKMFRDVKAVSRFLRWAIVTLVAIFVGGVALGENIAKVVGWIRNR
jgi:hypothetical protein